MNRSKSIFSTCCLNVLQTSIGILFLLFCLIASNRANATIVSFTYEMHVSDPNACGCVSGDLSGGLDVLMDDFPGKMEVRYEYDSNTTPNWVYQDISAQYPAIIKAQIRIGEHIFSAVTEDMTKSIFHVDNFTETNPGEDLIAIGFSSEWISYEIVGGPLTGKRISLYDLPIIVFRTNDTNKLSDLSIPVHFPLEGWEEVHTCCGSLLIVSDNLGDFGAIFEVDFDTINSEVLLTEPTTLVLLTLGLAGIGFTQKKIKN